ncbi:type II CAAX endopeptidase family protein [Haloechinothrix sp. LS1_15]|uniref:CPBP family intramembrane glutamic endopeptidase n=1 Tax=Haloechinothrix sp. LS1_15 TaxID=2652248 RepID=UPI0029452940|nr:type II CAAX endopeptidase family protein [Haloechinothrix sp. LS1_15]MDV6012815.1 CPBP family intramembrane metalloprotease [Haloechinothrix sp. LS1_15]
MPGSQGPLRPQPSLSDGLVFGAHWGLLALFLGLGGYHAAGMAVALAVGGVDPGPRPLEVTELGPVLLLAFVPNLLLGVGPALGSWLWGRGLRADFAVLPVWRDVPVGVACGGFALLAGYLMNLLAMGVYGPEEFTDSPLHGLAEGLGDDLHWLLVMAFVLVVVAPVTEELLVRGALWNALAYYRVPVWAIVVLSATVFAYLHAEPERTMALFAQGMVLGVARYLTGRVSTSIVAHGINNLPPAVLLLMVS